MYAVRRRLGDTTTPVNPTALAQVAALFAFYYGVASIPGSLSGFQNIVQNNPWTLQPPTLIPGDSWRNLENIWQNQYINQLLGIAADSPIGVAVTPAAIPVAVGLRIIDFLGASYNVTPPASWRTQQAALWAAANYSSIPSGTPQNQTPWYFNSPRAQTDWASSYGGRNPLLPLALPPVTTAITNALATAGAPGMTTVVAVTADAAGSFPWLKAGLIVGGVWVGSKVLGIKL